MFCNIVIFCWVYLITRPKLDKQKHKFLNFRLNVSKFTNLIFAELKNSQYFLPILQVIPLLSLSIAIVGGLHLGECEIQPLLPIWHIVAGTSGICTPFLYLLFDEVNPWLSRRYPNISEMLDNLVVFLLPVYVIFEVIWLITGTFWVMNTSGVEDPAQCNHTVYIFSYVVVVNFW